MRNVAVIGVGQTKFGELWRYSLRDLIAEAGLAALRDANVEKPCIDALYVGNMSAGTFAGQEHVGALAADSLGLRVPAVRCEAACASGGVAFRQAYHALGAGVYDVALVIGVEKMTELSTPAAVSSLALAGDHEWEASIGLTFAGLYALIARAHMQRYGTTHEQLAHVSVTNHKNAVGNLYAQFQNEITVEDVLNATKIADPLTIYDCSPITDGAAAVVLASGPVVQRISKPIWVLGSGQGTDTLALHDRASFTEMAATKAAAKRAFSQAGGSIADIDVCEVHDCFSINEVIALEDLGFCKKGEGGRFVERGEIGLAGSIPTNTTGGLKACGHPVGATGVRQVIEIARQLRGDSHNQLKDVQRGLALNIGGSGATAVTTILGRNEP